MAISLPRLACSCLALMLQSFSSLAEEIWNAPHQANPILPGYYADPSLLQHDGKFFLYATLDPWGGKTLGCWESSDFQNWTFRELNWPTKKACTSPTSKGAMVWAPSVVKTKDGRFFMYVSVGNEVWVGTAESPLGPWRNLLGERPLIPGNYKPAYHMIDAECFLDEDGTAYLYWGSGWNWVNGHCFAVKLKPDMATFDGEPADVTPEHYFEGPFMWKRGGTYYLTYSYGKTTETSYEVRCATGTSPLGPFKETAESPILNTHRDLNVLSPGHHALFAHEGKTYILYHRHSIPFEAKAVNRQTCLDEVSFAADGTMQKVTPTHSSAPLAQGRSAGLAATASASSERPDYAAANVLDDNYATRWAAAPEAKGASLSLDLGESKEFRGIEIRPEFAWKPNRFRVEASGDGAKWETLLDATKDGALGSPIIIERGVLGRYVRLVYPETVSGKDISLFEVRVY